MQREDLPLDRLLRQEILLARERVYRFGQPTPLEKLELPGPGPEIWVKREDLSPIKAYKWRGACNRMAILTQAERRRGVVTASAGNHAQGVALADEVILSGKGPFHAAFLQIGGGGLAAGVSTWLKTYWPEIDCVGVEGSAQASMLAALAAGAPLALANVDLFCDGTAVREAGQLPFEICKNTLSRIETVTNGEVSNAIRLLWEGLRCISEPSGAMGLAAVLKNREALIGKRVLIILCGANIDFLQLGLIAQSVGAGASTSRTLRVRIPERAGTMLELLNNCFGGLNITDFQYGKTDRNDAWPSFTIHSDDPAILAEFPRKLDASGFTWQDLTGAVDIAFRAIPLRGDLLQNPAFLRLDFYERPAALHDFLKQRLRGNASLCYFNYRQSGERIGRALIGLEFPSPYERDALLMTIPSHGEGYRLCETLDEATCRRLASSGNSIG